MFKTKLYDPRSGFFKVMEFKSLALALAKAKEQEKYRIKIEDGSQTLECAFDFKQGWIINKVTKI